MSTNAVRVGKAIGAVALLLVAAALGYAVALGVQNGGGSAASTASLSAEKTAGSSSPAQDAQVSADSVAPQPAAAGSGAVTPSPQRYVVVNTQMNVEVKDASATVSAVRTIATASGSEIAALQYSAGAPQPIAAGESAASLSPASAQITLRVPAEKLAGVQSQLAKLGTITSQSASQSDVTQQHVDLAARLKNLRAEEAQLRAFYAKARNVTDLLAVQQQLSTVRGEIESMQAQLDYLERQAALATLTLSLTEPGPIVRPNGTDWGFSAAVTAGVQGAAALTRAFITVTIALAPVVLLGLVVWSAWRTVRRRRAANRDLETESADVME